MTIQVQGRIIYKSVCYAVSASTLEDIIDCLTLNYIYNDSFKVFKEDYESNKELIEEYLGDTLELEMLLDGTVDYIELYVDN